MRAYEFEFSVDDGLERVGIRLGAPIEVLLDDGVFGSSKRCRTRGFARGVCRSTVRLRRCKPCCGGWRRSATGEPGALRLWRRKRLRLPASRVCEVVRAFCFDSKDRLAFGINLRGCEIRSSGN